MGQAGDWGVSPNAGFTIPNTRHAAKKHEVRSLKSNKRAAERAILICLQGFAVLNRPQPKVLADEARPPKTAALRGFVASWLRRFFFELFMSV